MDTIIKITSSLIKATYMDCFDKNMQPYVNKIFFWMDPFKKEFRSYFRILNNEAYESLEMSRAINQGSLYVVSNLINQTNFVFKLILEKATEFDFIEYKQSIYPNVIYYIKNGEDVSGPFSTTKNTVYSKIKNALDREIIYVPSKKQTYEPIQTQKTA